MGEILINLDRIMLDRRISLKELSIETGINMSNLSLLKNGHVRAVRFSTLEAICELLDCQPGDILEYSKTPRKKFKQQ
jgi:putative transcriptional regulator